MSLIQLLKYDMHTVSNLVKWGRMELFVHFSFFLLKWIKTKRIIVKLQYQLSGTTRCLKRILLRIKSYNKILKSADWKYDWMRSDTIIYESQTRTDSMNYLNGNERGMWSILGVIWNGQSMRRNRKCHRYWLSVAWK